MFRILLIAMDTRAKSSTMCTNFIVHCEGERSESCNNIYLPRNGLSVLRFNILEDIRGESTL